MRKLLLYETTCEGAEPVCWSGKVQVLRVRPIPDLLAGFYWLCATNKAKDEWRILKFSRLDPFNLDVFEDPVTYTQTECAELLGQLHSGNTRHGGLKLVLQVRRGPV